MGQGCNDDDDISPITRPTECGAATEKQERRRTPSAELQSQPQTHTHRLILAAGARIPATAEPKLVLAAIARPIGFSL